MRQIQFLSLQTNNCATIIPTAGRLCCKEYNDEKFKRDANEIRSGSGREKSKKFNQLRKDSKSMNISRFLSSD